MFQGHSPSLEAAKEEFKRLWPIYRAQWTDEDIESARAQLRDLDERTRLWNAKHRPAVK
ncbi:hypothetical protein BIWAKO_00575 [Bosea sp. BIWAKO-01]|nr:hypothetical protein BIWAKO_00575 [Bosea sp. BIWAKO-01]